VLSTLGKLVTIFHTRRGDFPEAGVSSLLAVSTLLRVIKNVTDHNLLILIADFSMLAAATLIMLCLL
jgi:hypothetical protein